MGTSTSGNRYLAHSIMKYIGMTGTGCDLKEHGHFAATVWEFCTLQDLYRGADLLETTS
jgi:hypothetical protein